MDDKLKLAIETIFGTLTTVWEDNGNIMADAVRDSVLLNLSKLTGLNTEAIQRKIEEKIENA